MKVGQTIQHKKPDQDDSLVPLINIVFLMLIFFMVAGHISQSDPIKVQPPLSASDTKQIEQPLVIVVSDNGQVAIEQDIVADNALLPAINKQFEAATDKEKFRILVKVDGSLPVDRLQHVLSIIKQSGIKRVSLATQKQAEIS
ncbi:biopolymer transporter ExbD [Methylophaga thalassica]|uniref:ExbD/TolR family protein n=1 Tax=Methylophaga thalassica TaxID=40223 RepID=UPI002E7BA595|nr:biopolymer transporter ExbD [Methylophaga thalassica]WVI86272.1 biopolymer transporter ExbD [Methylophaga thalassica]